MRKMKKIIASISVAAMLVLSGLSVYAQEEETAEAATEVVALQEEAVVTSDGEMDEMDKQSLASYAQQSIEMIVAMTDEQIEEILHPTSILSVPQESIVASVQSWKDMKEELGAYQSVKEHHISVTDENIVVTTTCAFENADGQVATTLDRKSLTMETMAFTGAVKTLGENMVEAGLNTVMGICVVFLMLLFLSVLIGQFKHISTLEEKMKNKNKGAEPAAAPAPAAPVAAPVVEETVDDGELIAVIAAAIAAAEGTSTDGFVVRPIKRSNRNKWQRA